MEERNLVDEYAVAIQQFKFTKEFGEAADRGTHIDRNITKHLFLSIARRDCECKRERYKAL